MNNLGLILNAQPYIKSLASKLSRQYPRFLAEDLVGYGNIGLLKALPKFDQSRNKKFNAFASKFIKGAIIDHIRKELYTSRNKKIAFRPISVEFDEEQFYCNLDNPYSILCKKQTREIILNKIRTMPELRKQIFLMRYYWDMKFSDIAKSLNISRNSVESNKSVSLKKLRDCEIFRELSGEF